MDDKLRGVFELWVEYLKRSKKYKSYCDHVKADLQSQDDDAVLFVLYSIFGDIYSRPIGDVLNSIEDWNIFFTPIYDYAEQVENDIDKCVYQYKIDYDREPTAEEIKAFLVNKLSDPSNLYLKVSLTEDSMEGLTAAFNMRLRMLPSTALKKEERKKLFLHPSTRIRLDELRRYLKIYDLWEQGLSKEQIINKLDSSKNPSEVDVQRVFYRDLKKAKKIIENVEKGLFPGNYA